MEFVRYTTVTLDLLGQVYVGYTDRGICYLTTLSASSSDFAAQVRERYGCGTWQDDSCQARWQQGLSDWLQGEAEEVPLDLSRVTPFEHTVMLKTIGIRRGTVRTYQWLAEAVGNPRASRAVGGVMRRNPVPFLVPCHRVVASSGVIGNYSMGGADIKRELLQWEGVDLSTLKEQVRGERVR